VVAVELQRPRLAVQHFLAQPLLLQRGTLRRAHGVQLAHEALAIELACVLLQQGQQLLALDPDRALALVAGVQAAVTGKQQRADAQEVQQRLTQRGSNKRRRRHGGSPRWTVATTVNASSRRRQRRHLSSSDKALSKADS